MNKARLEYEMAINEVSVDAMCMELGISRSAFYRKRNGKSEFTRLEMQKMMKILHLKSPMGIFF